MGWCLRGNDTCVAHVYPDQARSNVADTKKRISESEKRVDSKLGDFVNKQYWCADAPAAEALAPYFKSTRQLL